MAQGWIAIHRKITEHKFWNEKPFTRGQAWIDLLLMANHEDNTILFDGNIIEVKRGQKITSIRKLSERWGWSTTKIKKFFEVLQNEKMLTYFSNSKKTTYDIVNYNDYQDIKDRKNNTEITQKKHRSNTEITQKNTNNNVNNDNNVNNVNNDNNIVFSQVIKKWNELPDNIQSVNLLKAGTQRYKMLHARVTEYGIDEVIKAIDNIKASKFLQGNNNNGWTINFDWFIRPNNFIKVLEGNYRDRNINTKPLAKKGQYIEDKDILTDEEKQEKIKSVYDDINDILEKY